MKRSWIKLWIEVLHDPKMERLPDWEWRRAVEMFLLAGEHGDDGFLPTMPDMAYILRISETKLAQDLGALSTIGVVSEVTPGQWVVCKFRDRQYSESLERVRRYRNRDGNSDSNALPYAGGSSLSSSSSSASASRKKKRVQGKEKTKANEIPEVLLFWQITGKYPREVNYPDVRQAIGKVTQRIGHVPTTDDLSPFFRAWCARDFNPGNLAWLTDWAVSGVIPNGKPTAARGAQQDRNADIHAAFAAKHGVKANGR